jgi:hypothetical protein
MGVSFLWKADTEVRGSAFVGIISGLVAALATAVNQICQRIGLRRFESIEAVS